MRLIPKFDGDNLILLQKGNHLYISLANIMSQLKEGKQVSK